jgi:hypothetical protein
MKIIPWIAALLWLALRTMAGRIFQPEDAVKCGVLINIGIVLILVFMTIYLKYKNYKGERPTFLDDIKSCMTACSKYAIGVVICIGSYYTFMSDDKNIIFQKNLDMFSASIDTDEKLAILYQNHPELKNLSREQLIATNKERVETIFSIKILMSISLFVLILVSMVYSLIGVLFWRRVVKQL